MHACILTGYALQRERERERERESILYYRTTPDQIIVVCSVLKKFALFTQIKRKINMKRHHACSGDCDWVNMGSFSNTT